MFVNGRVTYTSREILAFGSDPMRSFQFKLFRTNGFVWALACASPLVPVLDRLLPGRAYSWTPAPEPDASTSPASTGIPIGAFAFDGSVHHVHGGYR